MTMWESQVDVSPEEAVRRFIVRTFLFGCDEELDRTVSLHRSGVLDSTGLLELITFLEHAFQIVIADEDLVPENFDSLRSIGSFLAGKGVSPGRETPLEWTTCSRDVGVVS